jgi:hypothetical protein
MNRVQFPARLSINLLLLQASIQQYPAFRRSNTNCGQNQTT